jgi:hypothetical protein
MCETQEMLGVIIAFVVAAIINSLERALHSIALSSQNSYIISKIER